MLATSGRLFVKIESLYRLPCLMDLVEVDGWNGKILVMPSGKSIPRKDEKDNMSSK